MHVKILADFTKNGKDMNEPHIVFGTDNVYLAGQKVKHKLEKEGCIVQSLIVIDGSYTLEQLHDMANYGAGFKEECARLLYMSEETMRMIEKLRNNPDMKEVWQQEINRKMEAKKKFSCIVYP